MDAEFFDIFGIAAFIFITSASVRLLRGKRLSRLTVTALVVVGVLGLLMDLYTVTTAYLLFF